MMVLRTCKKMKTTLIKKDDGSITIKTQFEHTEEQINKRPNFKNIISSEVIRCLGCIVRSLLLICISGIY